MRKVGSMPNAVLASRVAERERLTLSSDELLARIDGEERDPTKAELEIIEANRTRMTELEAVIGELVAFEEQRAAAADARRYIARDVPQQPLEQRSQAVHRPSEQAVYRTFAQWAFDSLVTQFPKMAARFDPVVRERAAERLERLEAAAPAGSTLMADIPGLLQPQHMTQIFDVINADRPVVSSARKLTLTSTTVTYPHITARPTVDKQVGEKEVTPASKMSVALASFGSDTYTGVGDLSWQDIQFSSPQALGLWFDLCAEAYAAKTEQAACGVVDAAAAAGGTVATATFADYWAAIADAAAAIVAASGITPNVVYASPDVGFSLAGMTSAASPVFNTTGAISIATGQGTLAPGLGLVTSKGFPPNTLIVGNSQHLLVGETPGSPERLQAVEVSIGGVEVGLIGQFGAHVITPAAFAQLTPPVTSRSSESSSKK